MNKEKLIEKYRDAATDYEWWEYTYEGFKETMLEKGVRVDEMSFDGFHHQGAHATFSISVLQGSECVVFMEAHALVSDYQAIYLLAERGGVKIEKDTGRESGVETDNWAYFDVCEDPDMDEYYKELYQSQVEETLNKFEDEVADIFKGYESDLYDLLYAEYECLTSDEVVWEIILANEWDKNEEDNDIEEEEEVWISS